MNAEELARLAEELGIDALGASPAEPYGRPSGTSASGARAACSPTCASRWRSRRCRAIPRRCSTARAPSSRRRSATTPRPRSRRRATAACRATPGATRTRSCASGSTRSAGGSAASTACSSTRTSTSTARRPSAPGVGFYGKNTMVITRRHGSWVVLGTLVTDRRARGDAAARPDCGTCTLCIDACPTDALDEPGELDATRCLSYWTQSPRPIPDEYPRGARRPRSTAATSARTSARGTAGSRSGARASARRPREPIVSLVDWLEADDDELAGATTGSSSRATTRATCAGTRSSRSGTGDGTS